MRKLTCFAIVPSNREKADKEKKGRTLLMQDDRRGLVEKPSSCTDKEENCLSVNFDDVYEYIIKAAIQEAVNQVPEVEITCIRGIDIQEAGDILDQLLPHVCKADITITDLTTHNPNVFLEYGIRLAVKDQLNIIIAHESVELPFNIANQRYILYSLVIGKSDEAKRAIAAYIKKFIAPQEVNLAAEKSSLIKRNVELHSGRKREQDLLKAYESVPQLIVDLASFLMTNGNDLKLKRRTLKFLEMIGEVLERDESGLQSAIAHYRLMATIEGMKPTQLADIYYKLSEVYGRNPETKQEADEYLEKVKELDKEIEE